jgi:hypothetical protein
VPERLFESLTKAHRAPDVEDYEDYQTLPDENEETG